MLKISTALFQNCVKRHLKFDSKMSIKAVRVQKFGGPEVLKIEEIPKPKFGDDEVLIKIHAAGVNPVETYIRSGIYAKLPGLPYTPGADGAGVIEAVGANVKKLKPGDRVFCTRNTIGSYAEYAVSVKDSVWPLPQRLTFSQGAGIGIPYFTAYRALFQKAHARPSQTLLIHGASGACGLAATQLARAYGMTVFGTAGTDEGLELVKKSGAHHVFNHRNKDYQGQLLKETDGQGFDVILEMLANVNLGKDSELVKQFGTVVIIGSRGKVEIDPRFLMVKDATVVGIHLGMNTSSEEWADIGAALVAGFENGTLTPIVDKEYPLEKASDAHRDIIESSGAKGNLILKIGK